MKSSMSIIDKNLDRDLTVYYQEAIKDDDFKRLLVKLKIKETVARRYTTKLENTVSELKNCKNCKGLYECKNKINGFINYPTLDDDNLRFDYIACKHKQKEIVEVNNNLTCFDEPLEIKRAKMSEIDLTDKKRVDAIKWVNKFYKEYQNNKHAKGLFLHGSFGSGKTYILAALLNELSREGAKTIIMYFPEMLRTLKESFDDDFKELMDNIKNCDLLLMDDVGAENLTNWSRDEILATILQYRMENKLPTFISSNLDINELERHLSKGGLDQVKAKRLIERIKFIMDDIELISENRRKNLD